MIGLLARAACAWGLCLAMTAQAVDVVPYGDNPVAARNFTRDGNRFYYEVYGSGEPLLLLHGNGQSIAAFDHQIGVFAQRYQVIAMDSRGRGKSELGTQHLTYEQMADDTNMLLEQLKLDHVKIVGWSDGGIIGLLLAIRHPNKVGMLAVMGANMDPEAAQQWALDGLVRVRSKINTELAAANAVHGDAAQLKLQLQLIDLLEHQPHIAASDLAHIQAPTLVMAGDRDVIRNAHTLQMFDALPKAQLEIFHGATHMIPRDDAERFNRTVLEFFDKPFTMPDTKDLGWFD
jgi:pimeloyl-ACP methyl ester carboxylesterase